MTAFSLLKKFKVHLQPAVAGLDFGAGFRQLDQHGLERLRRRIQCADMAARHRRCDEIRAGLDAIGQHRVVGSAETINALHHDRAAACALDPGAHAGEKTRQVPDFGLARRSEHGSNPGSGEDSESGIKSGSGSSSGVKVRRPDWQQLVAEGEISLSLSVSSLDMNLTQAGAIMGSPGYKAPDQHMSRPTDPRTRVHSDTSQPERRAETWAASGDFGVMMPLYTTWMSSGEAPILLA